MERNARLIRVGQQEGVGVMRNCCANIYFIACAVTVLTGISDCRIAVGYPDDEALYTGPNLQARYIQNRLSFEGVRFRWRIEHEQIEAYRLYLTKTAEGVEKLANDSSVAAAQRAYHKTYAEHVKKLATEFRSNTKVSPIVEVWSHDDSVQIRQCVDPTIDFSDDRLSKESLLSSFRHIGIHSNMGPGARWVSWTGQSNALGAVIDDKLFGELANNLPPLLPYGTVSVALLHPFDLFFLGDANELQVIGTEVIDSHQVLVVDRIAVARPEDYLSAERLNELRGRVRKDLVTRAWIDPSCGCVPRRISILARFFLDGKEIPYPVRFRDGVPPRIDGVQIEKCAGGGFFPVTGTITSWMGESGLVSHSPEPIIDGQSPVSVSMMPLEYTRWHAERVEAQRNTEFDLSHILPEDTIVHDTATKEMMVQDQVGGLVRASMDQLVVRSKPRSRIWLWLGGAMVLVVLTFFGYRFYRRAR